MPKLNLVVSESQFTPGFDNRIWPCRIDDFESNPLDLLVCSGVVESLTVAEAIELMNSLARYIAPGGELHLTSLDVYEVAYSFVQGVLDVQAFSQGLADKRSFYSMDTLCMLLDEALYKVVKKCYNNANIVVVAKRV